MKFTFKSMRVLAPLSILLASVATPAVAGPVELLGEWNFFEKSGDFHDKTGRHNGVVGYEDEAYDGVEGNVMRNKGRAIFEGKPNSIVIVEDDTQGTFDATMDITYFRYSARFKLQYDVLTAENEAGEPVFPANATWNLMQKGFSNNAGGQWKMQIKRINGQAYLQCVIKDSPGLQIEATAFDLAIKPTKIHRATCAIDRRKNLLKAILINEDNDLPAVRSNPDEGALNLNGVELVASKRGVIPSNFFDITPQAGECAANGAGTSEAFGQNVIIGNKPACPNAIEKLDASDQFVGKIYQVKVTRQTVD